MAKYVLSNKPKRGPSLPEWLSMLPKVKAINENSRYVSMAEIAEQCDVTSHGAFSVLGNLIKPVTQELQGNHWVDKFSIPDVHEIGRRYKAGYKWREKVEPGEARELAFDHLPKDAKKKLTVTAVIRGLEFHGQRFIHAAIDKGDSVSVAREFIDKLLAEYNLIEVLNTLILIESKQDPSKASISAFDLKLPSGKVDVVTNLATTEFLKAVVSAK